MALASLNVNPTRRQLQQFAGIWMPAAVLVGTWLAASFGAPTWILGTLLASATIVACVGLAKPDLIRPIFVTWMLAAYPIGWVVSHLLLATLFFVVASPVGLLMRLFGIDPMKRSWDKRAATYWQRRPKSGEIETYFRQY